MKTDTRQETTNTVVIFDMANPLNWLLFGVSSVLLFTLGIASGEAVQHLDAARLRALTEANQQKIGDLESQISQQRLLITKFCNEAK